MGSRQGSTWAAGVALSAAMHAGAGYLLFGGPAQQPDPQALESTVQTVRLVAAPRAVDFAAAAATAPATAQAEQAPARAAPRFYLPDELEREPIVLRDRTAEAGIELAAPCVLQLFIDARGRVVMVKVEGEPPPALARRLRAAFGAIEFLPGMLGGKPVPVRLRIELQPAA